MASTDSVRDAPPGLLSGLLFFAVVMLGAGYIVFSKLHEFSALQVTLVPVLIMIAYASALGLARLFRLRDDQSGDNLYYMGFLFTLTSLAVSLYQFSSAGSAEQIVQNFGIAIGSTIAGITLRIFFNQMRRDPVEVEHAALGTSASLLLQVIVPLALGIVLSRVRLYLDRIVEQVFFRKKYLAEKALRSFARHCTGYENTQGLLAAAAQIIHEKLSTPGVALYLRKDGQYAAAAQQGDISYPESANTNDAAFAAARSGVKDIDLSELRSALGSDGYVFPMGAQAVLVCANRPGEHYAADERKLLATVARQVGRALHSMNIRESLDFVRAVARGSLDLNGVREQALKLEAGWVEN